MKYHNKKVVRDGETFDSVKEYHDWLNFVSWKRVESYQIFRDRSNMFSFHLSIKSGKKKKCIERECSYISDFSYFDSDGKLHVEGCKRIQRWWSICCVQN